MDLFQILNNAKIAFHGITGLQGSMHAKISMQYGKTNIVAGITPGKGGSFFEGNIPIYDSLFEAKRDLGVNMSIIFVPPKNAADSILEAIDAKMDFIYCVTEGVPVYDMAVIKERLRSSNSILLGPNSPGCVIVDKFRAGIFPVDIFKKGKAAVFSRSGTLTYAATQSLTNSGIGQAICVGIGGDAVHGLRMVDLFNFAINSQEIDQIIFIGEIGGSEELDLAKAIEQTPTKKKIFAYIAGKHSPAGTRMGHSGAIIGVKNESASSKIDALRKSGCIIVDNIFELGETVRKYQLVNPID